MGTAEGRHSAGEPLPAVATLSTLRKVAHGHICMKSGASLRRLLIEHTKNKSPLFWKSLLIDTEVIQLLIQTKPIARRDRGIQEGQRPLNSSKIN